MVSCRSLAALVLLGLAGSAAALPIEDTADALERASRILGPRDASLGSAVRDVVGPADDPLAPQGAGPSAPEPLVRTGAEVVLWLLAAGGFAASVALGWRHLHARNVRDHPQRAAILALLRAHPGLHLRAVARATGQPAQQAAYHLRMLERLGCVRSQVLGGKRCYLEAGAAVEVRRALLEAALQPGDQARRVLDFVQTHPGASQSEVARQLGMLPGSARWHLQRLAAHGQVVEQRAGKAMVYRARAGPRL